MLKAKVEKVHATAAMMHASKKTLLWGVDRSLRDKCLRDFVRGIGDLHFEITRLTMLHKFALWRLLSRHKTLVFESTFYIAVLQSVVLLDRYSGERGEVITPFDALANDTMGWLQVLSCCMSFASSLIQTAPLDLKKENLWPYYDRYTRTPSKWGADDMSPFEYGQLLAASIWCVLSNQGVATSLLLLVAAILGLCVSPLWFTIHLLDIVNKSSDLMYVFKARDDSQLAPDLSTRCYCCSRLAFDLSWEQAVTVHGNSIMMTALFVMIVIFIYAAIGHGLLPRDAFNVLADYEDDDWVELNATTNFSGRAAEIYGMRRKHDQSAGSDGVQGLDGDAQGGDGGGGARSRGRMLSEEGGEYCSSLLFCWVAAVNEGLRSGDIGALMPTPDPRDEMWEYVAVVLYQARLRPY